jgi:hypothetical protein
VKGEGFGERKGKEGSGEDGRGRNGGMERLRKKVREELLLSWLTRLPFRQIHTKQ